jgi:hypothetical protein
VYALRMLKFTSVKMFDIPCVTVCVSHGGQVEWRHPEDGLRGPKHVGA